MTRQKLIVKTVLVLLLGFVVVLKLNNPNPDWSFEISTDLVIVLIVLGAVELMLNFLYAWLAAFFIRPEWVKIKSNNQKGNSPFNEHVHL